MCQPPIVPEFSPVMIGMIALAAVVAVMVIRRK
jgi:hypothetical protein